MKTLGDFKTGDMIQLRPNGKWWVILYFQGMNDHQCYLRSMKKKKQRNTQMSFIHKLLPITTSVNSWGLAHYIDESVYPEAKDKYGHTLQRLAE